MKKKLLQDEIMMEKCLGLAQKGAGWVSPNPMVGCVIVKDGTVVAEGYHERFGGWHAEVNALRKAGNRANGSTLYVNLEPCAHYGKTPPCVDAILAAGVKRVVVAVNDPNPLVSGKGLRALERGGVEVKVGVGRKEAARLNEKFLTFIKTGLPFVGMKVAQTLDARIADLRGQSKWITSKASRAHAHYLRSTYDAVVVGATTIVRDNPQLTVRAVRGRDPLRIVLDGKLNSRPGSKIFNTRKAKTLVITTVKAAKQKPALVSALTKKGVQIIAMDLAPQLRPRAILKTLGGLGISSVLIEGGSQTIGTFLQAKCVQRVHCFIAPTIFGGGLQSVSLARPFHLTEALQLFDVTMKQLNTDILVEGSVKWQ